MSKNQSGKGDKCRSWGTIFQNNYDDIFWSFCLLKCAKCGKTYNKHLKRIFLIENLDGSVYCRDGCKE